MILTATPAVLQGLIELWLIFGGFHGGKIGSDVLLSLNLINQGLRRVTDNYDVKTRRKTLCARKRNTHSVAQTVHDSCICGGLPLCMSSLLRAANTTFSSIYTSTSLSLGALIHILACMKIFSLLSATVEIYTPGTHMFPAWLPGVFKSTQADQCLLPPHEVGQQRALEA